MCKVCGCNQAEVTIESTHGHHHEHHHNQHLNFEKPSPELSESTSRIIEIEQNILSKNNYYAGLNREKWSADQIFAINFISSPGSGKTTLLTEIIKSIKAKHCIYVIEGDQQTALDATRIRETGVQALQINTGKGCHLDAQMVGHAAKHLAMQKNAFLFIENVGNLICPAGFDLGEAHKVVILSVTEGEDKPLKYPEIFHAADLLVINKIDLLPYVNFNLQQCCDYAKQINPKIEIIRLSTTSGENMEQLSAWLIAGKAKLQSDQKKLS
ncbi:MAG: hydrogenase nickel incorporation protein HypB [Psychromonas sp.]|jgi:hydrogenase nickel incorporation protein HypB|uniref:hydrogenase nickel incorporation protein HypB n=1 Tax=Psychromonas sp. TaxID=1884585 RepID=UPI0039E4EBCD